MISISQVLSFSFPLVQLWIWCQSGIDGGPFVSSNIKVGVKDD